MATYAIGDIQGCFDSLMALLDRLELADEDRLWLVGDLVNRGPRSADVLRWAKGMGEKVTTVLGNHDLHLLGCAYGVKEQRGRDTLSDVLSAPDRIDLLEWLRHQPLMVCEDSWVLVHAGLNPTWSVADAFGYAGELEDALQGNDLPAFLEASYLKPAPQFSDDLDTPERLAAIFHTLTRTRICMADGTMDLTFKSGLDGIPRKFKPWFEHEHTRKDHVVFGHWSALGLHRAESATCIDSGCVWGRSLTALRLDDGQLFHQVSIDALD